MGQNDVEIERFLRYDTVVESHNYRIYSNKRRGAYFIFRVTNAALILRRQLFEGGAYLNIVPDKFTFSIFSFNGTLSIC